MPILGGEEREEDAALVERFELGDRWLVGTFDETVGGSHVEDEFVADELGEGVVGVGAR